MGGAWAAFFRSSVFRPDTLEDDIDECAAFTAWALHTPLPWFLNLPLLELSRWGERAAALMEKVYGNKTA
jgi:hypothetical protein